ncbi:CWC16 protein [Catenaria anguillulae PL171]|uniref:Splicing factor YJU2 n=1 Tax=Catenaria anguillulae PL171 TaxID=765915 RepID=A0A1Y2HR16_9FUNG|nr:CWC16 protein [Catenaria anguillulae PL171]
MSERKVLNKYFPPNFDPSKIPRRKKPLDVKDKRHKVRLMAPFSMQCETCREFIYKGKKFNAIKETVKGEAYLSIKIFRFYIRCPKCHAEITFKTDPANLDYVAERGAVRNYDPRRDEVAVSKIQAEVKDEEEEMDPLKALENRTRESKREMQILDALEEVRTRNARVERVNVDGLLDKLVRDAEGEGREAREAFLGVDTGAGGGAGAALSKLRMAAIWSSDDDDNDNHGAAPSTNARDDGGGEDDDGDDQAGQDDEDLDALLLQYRLASSSASSSSAAAATSTKPKKKRSHAEVSAADSNQPDSLVTPVGHGQPAPGKHHLDGIVAKSVGKPTLVLKQRAPPPAASAAPKQSALGLLGLAYGDDDDEDSE